MKGCLSLFVWDVSGGGSSGLVSFFGGNVRIGRWATNEHGLRWIRKVPQPVGNQSCAAEGNLSYNAGTRRSGRRQKLHLSIMGDRPWNAMVATLFANEKADRNLTRRELVQRAAWLAAATALPGGMKLAAADSSADISPVMLELSAYISEARNSALPARVSRKPSTTSWTPSPR